MCAGCGYRVAAKTQAVHPFKTLSVSPLQNRTSIPRLEQILTQALRKEFVQGTGFTVVDSPSNADSVLEGAVTYVRVSPITYGEASFGSTFLVTIRVQVVLKDVREGKELFRSDNLVFREQYIINVDLENFFSELNPALERIALDFASSVVTTIREDF